MEFSVRPVNAWTRVLSVWVCRRSCLNTQDSVIIIWVHTSNTSPRACSSSSTIELQIPNGKREKYVQFTVKKCCIGKNVQILILRFRWCFQSVQSIVDFIQTIEFRDKRTVLYKALAYLELLQNWKGTTSECGTTLRLNNRRKCF